MKGNTPPAEQTRNPANLELPLLRQQAEAAVRGRPAQSLDELSRLSPDEVARTLQELQVYQVELEMQNEELRRAQTNLCAERARYFDLYDMAPVGYITVNEQGVILQGNLSAANLLGVPRGALIKRRITSLIFPEDGDVFYLRRKQLVETGKPQTAELRMVKNDGKPFWVRLTATAALDVDGMPELRLMLSDIDQRKQAEAMLLEIESFQRDVLNSLPAHIAVLDKAGKILAVNKPWMDFARESGGADRRLGVGADYLEACQAACLDGDSSAKSAVAGIQSVLSGKQERFTLEHPCNTPGHARWFSMEVVRPVGKTAGAIVAHTDITSRKKAEESLRDANQKLRLHFEQTPIAVIEWDLDFRVERWNPAAKAIFGFSREEAIGQHASFIVPESFRDKTDQIWQSLLKKIGGDRSSNPNLRKDGKIIHCEWYNTPLIDERGTVTGVASLIMDVTERKRAQQLLAWEKSALESIVNAVSLHEALDGLMLGLESQFPGIFCSVLFLDDDGTHLRHGSSPSLPDAYTRAIDGLPIGPSGGSCGTAAFFDRQVIVSDIATDPLWDNYRELALEHGLRACWSTPIRGNQRKILGTFAIYYSESRHPTATELDMITRAVHITRIAIERKRAEEKIRRFNVGLEHLVEERTRELQDANASLSDFKAALDEHALVTISDADGKITYANDKFCAVSQYLRDELIGMDHRMFNSGEHPKAFIRNLWNTIASGRVWKGEIKNRAKDGSYFWVNTTIVPFLGYGGKPTQFVAIRTDITAMKLAEEQISKLNTDLQGRAAQLEAANRELEAFSYSVSHDLRAPLRAVDGFSRMLLKEYAERLDDNGLRMLGVIRSETQRMGQLIDDLLAFSRLGRQSMKSAPINMDKMAQDIFRELAGQQPERDLRLVLHPLPATTGEEAMVRQAWVNLVSNAIKFTSGRQVAEIEIGSKRGEDGEVIYYIKDNGAGFDMRYAEKLFGVFQRLHTQQEFPGTGVGLALVQRIVQRHGGRIWAEGILDGGSTFYFTLPNQKQ